MGPHDTIQRPLTVLVAPSGFKENLSVDETIQHIITGGRRAMADARFMSIPMVDGGEGFTEALINATGGTKIPVNVTGPLGDPVGAAFGILGGVERRIAVLEMAAAAGLRLVPRGHRDPRVTTSYGVGELIKAALDAGAEEIIVGCGDSGINDGGAGMAQALGVGLLDAGGSPIGRGGAELARLHRIDLADRDPRLADTAIEVAVNWYNVLLGPRGVARVFGPQKGATPEMVEQLEQALERYAAVIQETTGMDVGMAPGSGASGGLGTGLAALLGATLRPRYQVVLRYLDVEGKLAEADVVVTAEGRLDEQTPRGKVPAEVARRASRRGIPTLCLAGGLSPVADVVLDHGVTAFFSIADGPLTLAESMQSAGRLLERAAEQALRAFASGLAMGRQQANDDRDAASRRTADSETPVLEPA
ncbi:MAG: glycerate kinase [Pseudomonadota bacterium]